jgi:uncharacterized protein (DUF983 family)
MAKAHHHRLELQSVLRLRCPECGDGRIFAGSLRMNVFCSKCGLRFEREPAGYFTGAMYFSYALAIPILGGLTVLGLWIGPTWSRGWAILFAMVAFVPFIPTVFRYSRVLFIHLDRALDPDP